MKIQCRRIKHKSPQRDKKKRHQLLFKKKHLYIIDICVITGEKAGLAPGKKHDSDSMLNVIVTYRNVIPEIDLPNRVELVLELDHF